VIKVLKMESLQSQCLNKDQFFKVMKILQGDGGCELDQEGSPDVVPHL